MNQADAGSRVQETFGSLKEKASLVAAKARYWRVRLTKPAWDRLRPFLVTLIAMVLAGVAVLGAPSSSDFGDPGSLLGSVAAMVGGVLALIIGLALLPIQRALETFTPSVARIFREDRLTQLLLLLMSVICVAGFVGSAGNVPPMTGRYGYVFCVVSVGIVLDFLRFFFRRATMLLDPREATRQVVELGTRHIDAVASLSQGLAAAGPPSPGEEEVTPELLEGLLQDRLAPFLTPIRQVIDELGEMAERAAGRSDTATAEAACRGIQQICVEYVAARAGNVVPRPVPEAPGTLAESGLDVLLTPACEALQAVIQTAATARQERACLCALGALGSIAEAVIPLNDCCASGRPARLSWKPLGYFKTSTLLAVRAGCDNVGIEASRRNLALFELACGDRPNLDELSSFASLWSELSAHYLAQGKGPVAELIFRDWMTALGRLPRPGRPDLTVLLSSSMDSLKALLPLMLRAEAGLASPFAPYNTTLDGNISQIVDRAAEALVSADCKPANCNNPFDPFIDFVKPVRQHLRSIGDQYKLGDSILLLLILQTLQHIAAAHIRLIDSDDDSVDPKHRDSLVSSLTWHLSFCWAVFNGGPKVNWLYSRQAADLLTWVGLHLLKRGFEMGPETCASFIGSISESVMRADSSDSRAAADLLGYARQLALAARHLGLGQAADQIDEKIDSALVKIDELGFDLRGDLCSAEAEWSKEVQSASPYKIREPAELLLTEILNQPPIEPDAEESLPPPHQDDADDRE